MTSFFACLSLRKHPPKKLFEGYNKQLVLSCNILGQDKRNWPQITRNIETLFATEDVGGRWWFDHGDMGTACWGCRWQHSNGKAAFKWAASKKQVAYEWPAGQCMTGQCCCQCKPTVASLRPIRQTLTPMPARGVQMAQNCSHFVFIYLALKQTKFADSKVSEEGFGAQYAARINVKRVERERHGKNTAHIKV